MKRFLTLCLALSLVLSMTAFAGEPGTIKEITAKGADYEDGDVNFSLLYEEAVENGMYLILVLSEEGTPKDGNILYVNQVTADGEGAYFENVYPTEIGEETSYIYLAGAEGYKLLGEIVPNVEEVSAILKGDVTGDGKVNMADVTSIRRWLMDAEKYPLTIEDAGDVTADDKINMADVTSIRRWLMDSEKYPLK